MASATPQIAIAICQTESYPRPSLLSIPRELRDMIIAPFLQSGDLIILRICHIITEEALQRITHEATFRVNFNIKGRENTVLEKTSIPANLQNVAIRFHLPRSGELGREDAFQSSSIRHLGYRGDGAMNRCAITISYDGGYSLEFSDERTRRLEVILPSGPRLLSMLSYALSGYTHFDTVGFEVVRGRLDRYWTMTAQDRSRVAASDAEFWKRLGPALGPAKLIDEGGKRHLEFHPRSHSAGPDGATVNVI